MTTLRAIVATLASIELLHALPAAAGPTPKVEFTGNSAVPSAQLRAVIAEHPLLDKAGAIDQEVLDRDLLLISSYYWDHGHAEVQVGKPVISAAKDAITIAIKEGPVFTIGSVTVTGELIGTAKENLDKLRVRAGATFSRSMIANDREALSTYYQDRGYASVNVTPIAKVDAAHKTIGLSFEIGRGKLSRFERIDVRGNSKTSVDQILAAMKIAAGDPYSASKLVEAKRRLTALELKDVVTSTQHGSSDELVVVVVEVRE
jgi:outer membrane protein insertion porin family